MATIQRTQPKMMRRRALTALTAMALAVGLALATQSAPASAQGQNVEQARSHYQQGVKLFDAGDYRSAITQFVAADSLAPSPLLDYNIGLCHERLGENAQALRRFRSYRMRAPNAGNRAEVDAKIARIERAAAPPPPTRDPVPEPDADSDPITGDPIDGPGDSTDPSAGTSTPQYAPTGDASLDRVAAVDMSAVAARHPSVSAPASPPPPVGGFANQTAGQTPDASDNPATPPDNGGDKPKPLYKRWWFWVVVGVSTIILIDIATSDSNNNSSATRGLLLDPSLNAPATNQAGGFTLRF